LSAMRTPFQGSTGCGAFHRNSSTGGAAKGIPLKTAMPFSTVPCITPSLRVTVASESLSLLHADKIIMIVSVIKVICGLIVLCFFIIIFRVFYLTVTIPVFFIASAAPGGSFHELSKYPLATALSGPSLNKIKS
jgi:hypothetical protein